jgi:tetratricopeptide (TPR) repeat protein
MVISSVIRRSRLSLLAIGLTALLVNVPHAPKVDAQVADPPAAVKVWQDQMVIPTYEEGLPDPNPPFDLFRTSRFNYPYTLRQSLSDTRSDKAHRALFLENEYLKCTVLPDVGGHLYGCTDKRNGTQMFYANPSLKFAAIAYRGAWAAFGVEFNFPVSHNWMTVSPVDFAITKGADGSGAIWVGNIDRPYGMQWRVQLRLRPGRAVLEQSTTLYNRNDVRHRFYWWTNAGVQVDDDSQVIYPMDYTASHGFTFVDTWPIDSAGHDLRRVGNHQYGPVSRFAHLSREPYMAVYHPKTKSGVVHYSAPDQAPAKKLWSWSSDADGLDWRRALSDNNSAYVEIQAGLFRNQETYGFLDPQQSLTFTEYWMPMLDLGGLSRANPDALVNLSRVPEKPGFVALDLALNVTRVIRGARVVLADGARRVASETVDLSPQATFRRRFPGQMSAGTYTAQVVDQAGMVVLSHTEGAYDVAGRGEVRAGAQKAYELPGPSGRSDGDFAALGMQQELEGQLLIALATYQDGLKRFPDSVELNRSAGRLMVGLKQYDAATPLLTKALGRVSNDHEAAYYLGLADAALGRTRRARLNWESSQQFGTLRAASLMNLAAVSAREGRISESLDLLARVGVEAPEAIRARAFEITLLRASGRHDAARARLEDLLRVDPTNSFLRHERILLGTPDEGLFAHLAGDPERIIELVVDYMRLGQFTDALTLLSRQYPAGPAVVGEPGMPRPESYALVAYYRGYCRFLSGGNGQPDFDAASKLPTTYVFPHRPESMVVLKLAIEKNANDSTANFLLGSLYLSGGMIEAAMKSWEAARAINPRIPTLHRNMGYTLLSTDGSAARAAEIFQEGTKYDAANVGLYVGLEQALTLSGRSADERARAILSYPDQQSLPASLVYKLALALAEAGRFDEADKQFAGRFFPREEGGTNVRQIYLEVKIRRAQALAASKDCRKALEIVGAATTPVAGLAFTRDGLEAVLATTTFRTLVDEVTATCGGHEPTADIPYTTGTWDADTLGNHRVVLRVDKPADVVWAHIPWRRRDLAPERKQLVVVEGRTGGRVLNLVRIDINRETGDIAFEAPSAGLYYVYYLPNVGAGRSNYPKVTYPEPEATADERWLARQHLSVLEVAGGSWRTLARATVTEIQAIDQLNSFFPMEVIATKGEMTDLQANNPGATYLVFPEDRTRPIKMTDDLPLSWIRSGARARFRGSADRGEYYSFQLGIHALRAAVEDVTVRFAELKRTGGGGSIAATAFRCINLGGVDSAGRPFTRQVRVEKGKVQPLWCGVQIPREAAPGDYDTAISVEPRGVEKTTVRFTLAVTKNTIPASGDNEPWRLSRLRWLDSTLAFDDDLVAPYTPVQVTGRTVSVLGRTVTLAANGFPERIESRFAIEMTHLADKPRQILSGPIGLAVQSRDRDVGPMKTRGLSFVKQARGVAAWASQSTAGPVVMDTSAQLEFDGNMEYTVRVSSSRATEVEDIRLEIPLSRDVARLMMGLGFKGGARPASVDWKWDVAKNNQDSAWVGDINAGLQFTLKDDAYVRPLNTNFYTLKPLVPPASWVNDGRGGCRLTEKDAATVLITCYSGARTLVKDHPLFFNFRLLLTPFKPIDTKAQFTTRFYHAFKPADEVLGFGANAINVHHANPVNPYINYPFLRPAEMKAYIDQAHDLGMKVKIYYTVRELTNRAPELFALRSLGDEVLSSGPGGGFSWLQEHLGSNYIAAWFVPELKDAAVVNSGVSRWHNFYVEGLAWLVKNVGIDGLYIDDVAFDRLTMKRVRKVLDRGRPGALIDLHSANQYNPRDGFASSANLYLEHFPFLNRLWFGEYFDYNSQPDYWLTEISGLPFGLMGEMLEGGGNPWRGMVYGMTGRLPWSGDPRSMWKAWDGFGIAEAKMIGYWVPSSPVKPDRADVLATAFVREGRTMVALASWAKERVEAGLAIDWKALGIDPSKARMTAPEIVGFQDGRTFSPGSPIPVEPGKGWLIVIDQESARSSSR